MSFQEIVRATVTGLGYELIELERSAGGMLRVTMDWPWSPQVGVAQLLTVEDCEKVTRQLQFALEVANVEYKRLEVSSPGIDRLLRNEFDFQRFVGETIDITLKQPVGDAAQGLVNANRKKFRGELRPGTSAGEWCIAWVDEPAAGQVVRPGHKNRAMAPVAGKKKKEVIEQVMGFALAELREARLAPIVNFKGRQQSGAGQAGSQD